MAEILHADIQRNILTSPLPLSHSQAINQRSHPINISFQTREHDCKDQPASPSSTSDDRRDSPLSLKSSHGGCKGRSPGLNHTQEDFKERPFSESRPGCTVATSVASLYVGILEERVRIADAVVQQQKRQIDEMNEDIKKVLEQSWILDEQYQSTGTSVERGDSSAGYFDPQ